MYRIIILIILFVSLCILTGCSTIKSNIMATKYLSNKLSTQGLDLSFEYKLKRKHKFLYLTPTTSKTGIGYDFRRKAFMIQFKTKF